MKIKSLQLALMLSLATGLALADSEIHGGGSTAAASIYKTWATEYQKVTGVGLVYDGIGSSAGVKKIAAGTVHFGASDVAPSEAELARLGLVLFPVAITGIAPVLNLPSIQNGKLKLTGKTLARIFSGEIRRWNDEAIVELNPALHLPNLPITVVVRADGSGTTYNFTDYLAKVDEQWKKDWGVKSSIAWPKSFAAVTGSAAVVNAVKQTPGTIGYVEFGYAKESKLAIASLQNAAGEFVTPGVDAFNAALANSEWMSQGRFANTLTNQGGKGSWPLTMSTFVLMPQISDTPAQTLQALKFFVWSFINGDRLVQLSNFVRLPDIIQAKAFKAISSIRNRSGEVIGAQSIEGRL
jgi:phosphate transport system substrate-binding protein